MPLFIIERNFAEAIEVDPQDPRIKRVNDDLAVQWLYTFLSANKKKTYCLYEAPSADAIREAARRLKLPADEVTEVGWPVGPGLAPALR